MYINRYWLIFLSNCTLFINYILFVKLVKETIVRDSDFLVERFDVKKNFFSIYLTLFFIFKYFSKLDIYLSSSNFDYTFIFNLPQYFVYFYIFCTSERIIGMRKKIYFSVSGSLLNTVYAGKMENWKHMVLDYFRLLVNSSIVWAVNQNYEHSNRRAQLCKNIQ